mgnify:FL=1
MCPQMKLNARQVETAKPKDKTYKMADGGGLYLEVSAKGSKYWRMKYRRPSDKKEDRLAFWCLAYGDACSGKSKA